jgi:two-component system, cell cycle sensor histidine kinase and response regulator CckA
MTDGIVPAGASFRAWAAAGSEDWRPILDMMPAGVVVHQAGVIVYVNPSATRMLGAQHAEQLVGRPAHLVGDSLSPPAAAPCRVTVACQGTAPMVERKLLRLDGTWFDAEVTAVPSVFDNAPAVFVTARDVSERNRAQAEVRRSEEKFRALFEHFGDAVFIHDIEGHFLEVNQAACERLGYSRDELLRKLPIDIEAAEPLLLDQRAGGDVRTLETAYIRRDGTVLPVELTSRNIEYEGEAAILSIARDISERKRAEAELRRLAEAVHQAGEAILITDTAGRIEYANPAFERVSGYTVAEATGLTPRILKSGRHPEAFYAEMWATITAGRTWTGRIVNRRHDGTLYTEDCTITPVLDHHGRIDRFVAVKRDITREAALEEQFRQTQRLESVGQLAAGIAHDLNNLLQPILGYAELALEDSGPDDPHYQGTLQIMEAGRRARELVRQLLAFGRKQALETKTADVRGIVDGLTELLQRTIREHVEVHVTASPEPCQAVVDSGQVSQVLMNLAVNAQDAMPVGGVLAIDVSTRAVDEAYCATRAPLTPGRYVVLTVADTGAGMDEETRLRMFEPFFTTKGAAGTGLGLATVYGIVRQHGGHITVDSVVGRGSTIRVYFPSAEAPTPGKDERTLSQTPRGSETVLVVEDDERVRSIASRVLERQGYVVISAASAAEAVEVAARYGGPIDLLLTDVIMPGGGGGGLHRRLSAARSDLRVLFMSGYARGVVAQQGVTNPDGPLLQKPFTLSELTTAVRRVLDGRAACEPRA